MPDDLSDHKEELELDKVDIDIRPPDESDSTEIDAHTDNIKIELTELPLNEDSVAPPRESRLERKENASVKKSGKKKWLLIILIGLILVVILAGGFIFLRWFKKPVSDVKPEKKSETTASSHNTNQYLDIGPIIARYKVDEAIRLSIQISCDTVEHRNEIEKELEKVESRLKIFLLNKNIINMVQEKNYQGLRRALKTRLNQILRGEPVLEIYFKEVLIFSPIME